MTGPEPAPLRDQVAIFEDERPLMMGIGYRILGSVSDAEDVVQEAWLRWQATEVARVENPEAFLTTVVTRLSLDRLRRLRARREVYPGPWLPEPVAADDPQATVERADSLSVALLVVLQALSPLERAAFVLREVFDQPYPEVAYTLGRTEAAVRQLVSRARHHVEEGAGRFRADRDTHVMVVQRFLAACQSADPGPLLDVLAPDVVVISDGGGVAPAPLRPVSGSDKVARLLLGIAARVPAGTVYALETFNGQLGIVARANGRAVSAVAVSVAGRAVRALHVIANPDKLAHLDRQRPPTHRRSP